MLSFAEDKINMLKKIIVILFFLSTAILYLHNLTRDIYSGDIGDLVTSAYVFGVAHPPGYPLFSLLGYILSHLPLPLPVVSKVGLISVIASFGGLIIFYKFARKITNSVFLSLLSTSILAFSYLFWLSAEIPEGLALNNFFAIVILYLSIRFYEMKKISYLYISAFFIGLSLTNQLHIVTLLPAVFILIVKHLKYIAGKRRYIMVLVSVCLGLLIYLYVPIAASRNPPINWDNASNLKNFIHLILRKDYGGVTKGATNVPIQIRLINVADYLKTVIAVFSYQILFLAFLGFIKIFKDNKRLALSILLAFLFSGVFSVFYIVNPVSTATAWGIFERYYTLSTVVLMFTVPYGFVFIKNILDTKFSKPVFSYMIISYFLIIPILLIKYNFPKTDLSETKIGNTLARNIFASLPRNSVLFVSGDNTTFSVWYLYYVLKERQDVDIINPPGVGNNIYLDKEINDFYKKNPQTDLKDVIAHTFDVIGKKRRMFTTYQIVPMPKGTILLPEGLVMEILKSQNIPEKDEYIREFETKWKKIDIKRRSKLSLSEQNFIAPEMPFIYSMGLVRVGDFLNSYYNDPAEAQSYYRRALWIDETNSQAYSGLAISLFKAYKDCDQSLKNIKQAIEIYPIWKDYYIQQYYFAKNCNTGIQKLSQLKKEFKSLFGQNIEKLIK